MKKNIFLIFVVLIFFFLIASNVTAGQLNASIGGKFFLNSKTRNLFKTAPVIYAEYNLKKTKTEELKFSIGYSKTSGSDFLVNIPYYYEDTNTYNIYADYSDIYDTVNGPLNRDNDLTLIPVKLEYLKITNKNRYPEFIYGGGIEGIYYKEKYTEYTSINYLIKKTNPAYYTLKSRSENGFVFGMVFSVGMRMSKKVDVILSYNNTFSETSDNTNLSNINFLLKIEL